MAKKKVILKASIDPSNKEKIVKFNNDVVVPIAEKKIENPVNGTKEIVKVVPETTIRVIFLVEKNKLKVTYRVNEVAAISKQFTDVAEFKTELKEVENRL